MDRGPQGNQSHPSEIRLFVREAGQHSRTNSIVVRSWYRIGRGRVYSRNWPFLTSSSSNNPTGDVHKRHRRAMAPAFGLVEAKGLLPYFMDSATKARKLCLDSTLKTYSDQMADKWSSIIENDRSGHSATIDVNMWLGKATLDA